MQRLDIILNDMFSKEPQPTLWLKTGKNGLKTNLKININLQTTKWQEYQNLVKQYKRNQIIERAHGGEKFYDNGEDITDQLLTDYVAVTNNIKNIENIVAYEKQILTKLENGDISLSEFENNIITIMQRIDFGILKVKNKKFKKFKNIPYLAKEKNNPIYRMSRYEAGLVRTPDNDSEKVIELKKTLASVIESQKEAYKKLIEFKEIKNSNPEVIGLYKIKKEQSDNRDKNENDNSVQYVPLSYINKNLKFYQEQYEKLQTQEKELREKINEEKNK